MAAFVYALPDHTSLVQEAAIARGLRGRFPHVDFERREGGFLTGDILPIPSRMCEGDTAFEPTQSLISEVRTAFAGLLIEALAKPSMCEACG